MIQIFRYNTMADKFSKETRSRIMSSIRGENTQPEMIVRRFLFSLGFRYRLHVKNLPGKPDIVLPKYKTVVFVHGCFWHGHENCKNFILPKTRKKWWKEKIEKNKLRDEKNEKLLKNEGWHVLKIFECELTEIKMNSILKKLIKKKIISV
jgi:DNA mismatch endonuclease (patch repair protein)